MARFTSRLWPIYAGGLIGPFGGGVVNPMLPELAEGLNTTIEGAASSITWYLVPLAFLIVFSGPIAHRLGQMRTVRLAYLLYAVASVGAIAAPTLAPFLIARAFQGLANACTTPVLIVILTRLVPEDRLGRALGTYASMQAAGLAVAPLVGGLAAAIDYRWAFAVSAAAGALLAIVTPDGVDESTPSGFAWRSIVNVRAIRASAVGAGLQLCATGILLLAALIGADRFGLSPTSRGLMIALFGAAGLVTGRISGRLSDAFGILRTGATGLLVISIAAIGVGMAPSVWLLIVATAIGGAASTASRILINTLALRSTPQNQTGAAALTMGVQALGSAGAPLLLLPIYSPGHVTATAVAALMSCAALALALIPLPNVNER